MREIEVDDVVDDDNGVDDDTEITDNGWDVAVALNVIFVNFGTWQPQSLPAGVAGRNDYIYSSRALWSTRSMR